MHYDKQICGVILCTTMDFEIDDLPVSVYPQMHNETKETSDTVVLKFGYDNDKDDEKVSSYRMRWVYEDDVLDSKLVISLFNDDEICSSPVEDDEDFLDDSFASLSENGLEIAGSHDLHENEKVLQKDSRRRDAWNTVNKEKDNGRRSGKQEDSKALVTLDGEGVDWTSHSEDEQENYAFMACGNGYSRKGQEESQKQTKPSTEWKRQSQIEAKWASLRSDLLFDDADEIDYLPNQAIFDVIQLMGYEGDLTVLTFNKALFSPQWRFLFHTMNHCISSKSTSWDQIPTNIATAVICLTTNQKYNFSKLIFDGMMRHLDAKKKFVMYPRFISVFLDTQLKNVPVPLDHFPINALTSKVFSFMVKKGKHFSGNVTPLFDCWLHQLRMRTNPSPRPLPTTHIPDSILEGSGGNHGGQSSSDRSLSGNEGGMTLQSVYDLCISLCTQVTDQAKEIKHLKAQIKKLKKKAKPVITHHKAWMKSVSKKQRLAGKKYLKKQWMQKESVSKQGRKPAKAEPIVHKDPAFDELDDDIIDYMETEDAQDVGRTSYVMHEEKECTEKGVSTEDPLSTAQPKVSTDKSEDSTDKLDESTDKPKVSTDKEEVSTNRPDEGTVDQNKGRSATQTAPTTTTPTIFGDD
ncbi:hypothetical protein Tco_0769389 [Tanacetum coccineum]|uniref:Uncharacterized protein n=1 Tax=Tanacetum coccineum TaxID=301880 RepID=A0ABQ4ZD46_9ASTR